MGKCLHWLFLLSKIEQMHPKGCINWNVEIRIFTSRCHSCDMGSHRKQCKIGLIHSTAQFHNIHCLIKYHRLLRSASLIFKTLQFYLSWPIQFSTKVSWSHAPASDCVNSTRPQRFTLTYGSFHTEDIVLQNIVCLRFIWLDMLHISIKNQI